MGGVRQKNITISNTRLKIRVNECFTMPMARVMLQAFSRCNDREFFGSCKKKVFFFAFSLTLPLAVACRFCRSGTPC